MPAQPTRMLHGVACQSVKFWLSVYYMYIRNAKIFLFFFYLPNRPKQRYPGEESRGASALLGPATVYTRLQCLILNYCTID